ncbi:MAG: hypothetical protein ACYTDW_03110 [Planctomycetota bacterium]
MITTRRKGGVTWTSHRYIVLKRMEALVARTGPATRVKATINSQRRATDEQVQAVGRDEFRRRQRRFREIMGRALRSTAKCVCCDGDPRKAEGPERVRFIHRCEYRHPGAGL